MDGSGAGLGQVTGTAGKLRPTVHYDLMEAMGLIIRNTAYIEAFNNASPDDIFRGRQPDGLGKRIGEVLTDGRSVYVILMEHGELARAIARSTGASYDEAELVGTDDLRGKIEDGLPPELRGKVAYHAIDAQYHQQLRRPVAALIVENQTEISGSIDQLAETIGRISVGRAPKKGLTLAEVAQRGGGWAQ